MCIRDSQDTVRAHYNPIALAIATMPKPVVAAVNGPAAGAGAGFAFAADLRLASERASFVTAFAGIWLSADSGMSWTLQRLVGYARASALLLLSEPVTAAQALDMGLVNAVVEPDTLGAAAHERVRLHHGVHQPHVQGLRRCDRFGEQQQCARPGVADQALQGPGHAAVRGQPDPGKSGDEAGPLRCQPQVGGE